MITYEELIKYVDYDREKGQLIWKERDNPQFNAKYSGNPVGSKDSDGYLTTKIKAKTYKVHKLVWVFLYKKWADFEIDHIDGDKTNNRKHNLRDVSKSHNQKNASKRKDNTSGCTGVTWNKAVKKWQSSLSHKKKRIHLGYFEDINDAIKARKRAEPLFGYHPNHGR